MLGGAQSNFQKSNDFFILKLEQKYLYIVAICWGFYIPLPAPKSVQITEKKMNQQEDAAINRWGQQEKKYEPERQKNTARRKPAEE